MQGPDFPGPQSGAYRGASLKVPPFSSLQGQYGNRLLLNCPRDASSRSVNIDIHFTADAEFRQVDARLDGKARPGQDAPGVVGFKVVHVCTIAVNIATDGVARTMSKVLAKALSAGVAGASHMPLPTR